MVAASAFLMYMSLEADNSEGEGNHAAADAYAAVTVTVRFFVGGSTIVLQGLRSCVVGLLVVCIDLNNENCEQEAGSPAEQELNIQPLTVSIKSN